MPKKYEEIARKIAFGICQSAYSPGDKLPSVRALSESYDVSVTTIATSLRLLESEGVVEAKDRVGYFIAESGVGPIPKERIHRVDPEKIFRNKFVRDLVNLNMGKTVPLGSAIPSDQYLPKRQIQKSSLRVARSSSHVLNYSFPGIPDYLAAIGRRMTNIGVPTKASDVIATNGAQEALVVALRAVTREGDAVAVASPTYPGILFALKTLNLRVIEIPYIENGRFPLETLEYAISRFDIKALCISSSFSNPTGFSLSTTEKASIVESLRQKDVVIIEDDIYGDLFFGSHRPAPLKAFDRDNTVIYCSSFSKLISPGLRCGWILPGRFYENVVDQKYFMNLASSSVSQAVISDYLHSGSYDRHLRRVRKYYSNNMRTLQDLVKKYFPEKTQYTSPNGGYLFWVKLNNDLDVGSLYEGMYNRGIYFAPGLMFSMLSRNKSCLRISASHPVDRDIEKSIMALGKALKNGGL